MRKLVIIVFLVVSGLVSGQSVTGTSGLIHIPSARMLEDGQLVLGAAYIPKPYFFRYGKNFNPGLNTYITYGILPFAEVMFRYTHELGAKVNENTRYFPDRMLSFRIRLINEKNYIPSLVLGFHDISPIIGGTSVRTVYNSASYLVATKKVKTIFGNIDMTIGYGSNLFNQKYVDYDGLFGGLLFSPSFAQRFLFSIEHNTLGINTGIKFIPFDSINILLGIWDLTKPNFSINYLF